MDFLIKPYILLRLTQSMMIVLCLNSGMHTKCVVCLNGRFVGVKMWAPYTFEIGEYLVDGENRLEITVTNPAANMYETNGAKSGLYGPVCILK